MDRSLNEGAIAAMEWNGARDQGGYYWQMIEAVAHHYHINLDIPVSQIPPEKLKRILYGTQGEEVTVHVEGRNGHQTSYNTAFEGVIPNLERRYRETNSEYIRNKITEYMSDRPCPTCKGTRLRPEAMAVTVDDVNIVEVTAWPVNRTLEWAERLAGKETPINCAPGSHCRTHLERDPLAAGLSGGCRPGLPDPAPVGRFALGRRGAAHPPGDPDRLAPDGRSVCAG